MAINSIQPNIETAKNGKIYRGKPIKTEGLTRPLPAEGHLVHDSLLSIPEYWIKDISYDLKAVRDGLKGTANDHQVGRLNDVGLKMAGIGIATYLASRTTNVKARLMEYLGLGAFLTSISLYPKIAINAPARVRNKFDISKEYIDDQGRKKSVLQDPNYIPFDMYRGEYPDEDLNVIGDRMGIPRDIQNRNELIKEQMRKIGIQNNTLWMMTAGFATPVMTALICCGLEKLVSPALLSLRNANYDSKIARALKETENMSSDINSIKPNSLSKQAEKLLTQYKDKELPKEEFEKLVKLISSETDDNLTQGIREDLTKLFKGEKNGFVVNEKTTEKISEIISESISGENKPALEKVFGSSKSEIEQALKNYSDKSGVMSYEGLHDFKSELKRIFKSKIESQAGYSKDALYMEQNKILDNISKSIQKNQSSFVSENSIKNVSDFAKIIGDFKSKDGIIDKCKHFKVEEDADSVLARYWTKYEKTMFEVLDIKYKDLKLMKESEKYTKEILEDKLKALAKDNSKYENAVKKVTKVVSDMDIALNGTQENESKLKDLISAIENNYNNTAKRLNALDKNKFSKTIDKLVKQDTDSLKNTIKSRDDLFNLLDGTRNLTGAKEGYEFAKEYSKGVGSSKALKISRITDRYQGVRNSFNRMIHTMDIYKREIPADSYYKELNTIIKDTLLAATPADHTMKLHTNNNPQLYRDIMWRGWGDPIQESTKKAVERVKKGSDVKFLERFNAYLKRFMEVIGNNDIDFTKPEHKLTIDMKKFRQEKTPDSLTRVQKFNLVGQSPVEFFKNAAGKRFENQTWLRKAGTIGATVLGITILAQLCFGRVKNPHNIIRKQVENDTTKQS